jgi:hypothetical protein
MNLLIGMATRAHAAARCRAVGRDARTQRPATGRSMLSVAQNLDSAIGCAAAQPGVPPKSCGRDLTNTKLRASTKL